MCLGSICEKGAEKMAGMMPCWPSLCRGDSLMSQNPGRVACCPVCSHNGKLHRVTLL